MQLLRGFRTSLLQRGFFCFTTKKLLAFDKTLICINLIFFALTAYSSSFSVNCESFHVDLNAVSRINKRYPKDLMINLDKLEKRTLIWPMCLDIFKTVRRKDAN